MNLSVTRHSGDGTLPCIPAVASKSAAHRLLILSALAKKETPTHILCRETNDDIGTTVTCLRTLGAKITRNDDGFSVTAIDRKKKPKAPCRLCVRESGSTLRFLLPVLGMLGIDADIKRMGRLKDRPLAPLDALLCAHGMQIWEDEENRAVLHVRGALTGTEFHISGGVSSQNITGFLMAFASREEESTLYVEGAIASAPYVDMTLDALRSCKISYIIKQLAWSWLYRKPTKVLCPPDTLAVEGDFSSAAAILCAGVLSGRGVTVTGLDTESKQGDKALLPILQKMGAHVRTEGKNVTVFPPRDGALQPIVVDADNIPDLVPVLAVTCGAAHGESVIKNCGRLRLKESDRLAATDALLNYIGVAAYVDGDDLHVFGICRDLLHMRPPEEGALHTPPAVSDHRMVMAAAIGALYTRGTVHIAKTECVSKSYPRFFDDITAFCAVTQTEEEEETACQAPTKADCI